MAEFSELVRIKKRICIKYKSSGCIECPIDCRKGHLCGIISISGYSDNEFMELEEALLSWDVEHPEPVYPSWIDWLMSEGVIPTNYMAANSTDSGVRAGTFYVTSKAFEHIPADIAQKLGIEPKEG